MATVSMTEGAKLVGRSKGTLSKALSSGRMSYVERTDNGYVIETSELFRVFPPKRSEPVAEARLETRSEPPVDKGLQVEVQLLREQLSDMKADRDAWRDQAQRLLLEGPAIQPAPPPAPDVPRRSGWRFWSRD